ncbi:MAG: maleylpyruvate isomerase N-terminal domain-containing protein [Actinomycetota bacterium]
MTRDGSLDGLHRERTRLLAAYDALGDDVDTAHVTEPGGWTGKDVLAHLIHYTGMIANALGAPMSPPAYVLEATGQLTAEEWNDRAVAFWKDKPAAEVRAQFVHDSDLLLEYAAKLTDEQLVADARALVGWANEGPLERFIGHDTFQHEWPAHAQQMEELLGNM